MRSASIMGTRPPGPGSNLQILLRSGPFVALGMFLAVLLVAGGASRADVSGQVVVRVVAWGVLVAGILLCRRPWPRGVTPVMVLLLAALGLVLAQLIPLPPAVWQALPGRSILLEAAAAAGQSQPWRPLAMVPGATINAAGSLVVPFAALCLFGQLDDTARARVPGLLMCLVVASMLVGLLQFSGARLNNPFVNDPPGQVTGLFANPNHFALFMAFGCLLAPAWAFARREPAQWRGIVALGLVLVLVLTIIASGSRAGLAISLVSTVIGIALAWRGVRRSLAGYPRWIVPAIVVAAVGMLAILVLASVAADRAVSIRRLFSVDIAGDMRSRAFPVVLEIVRDHFPFGVGVGGFDPVFRIYEPFTLLKVSYFNHAHNDIVEVVLESGLAGALLLLAAIAWAVIMSWRAWRAGSSAEGMLPRLGAAMLLLVAIASTIDYPARTPIIMASVMIAAGWLTRAEPRAEASALPANNQHL